MRDQAGNASAAAFTARATSLGQIKAHYLK
jgi:hypothetical protein